MIIGTPSHMIVSEERLEQRLCHARTEIRTCYPQQINITRSHQEITKGSWGQTECSNRYGECKKRHISLGQNGREHMWSLCGSLDKARRGMHDFTERFGIVSRY